MDEYIVVCAHTHAHTLRQVVQSTVNMIKAQPHTYTHTNTHTHPSNFHIQQTVTYTNTLLCVCLFKRHTHCDTVTTYSCHLNNACDRTACRLPREDVRSVKLTAFKGGKNVVVCQLHVARHHCLYWREDAWDVTPDEPRKRQRDARGMSAVRNPAL